MEQVTLDCQHYVGVTQPQDVVKAIDTISTHPDVVSSHQEWENYDKEWKDTTKHSSNKVAIMESAALVRESKKKKDSIADAAATLAHDVAINSDIIKEYTKSTLGKATIAGSTPELSVGWHNLRRGGIGGSTVSKVLGFHWKSRAGYPVSMSDDEYDDMLTDMAIDKMTPVNYADIPSSGVLYRGHMWEPAALAWLSVTHDMNIAVSKDTWQGILPEQIINVDGIIVDDDGDAIGLVECKTSSREWTWQWGVPLGYRAQVLWYLNATGLDYAKVIVRFDSGSFDVFTIHADETVDGTEATLLITDDEYMDIIFSAWDEVQYYRENTYELWSDSQRLNEEKNMTLDFVTAPHALDKEFFVEQKYATVVHGTFSAPYERMDESFTAMVAINIAGKDYAIRNIPYPLYPLEDKPDSSLPDIELADIDSLCDEGIILATNTDTYHAMVKIFGEDGVVNMSAMRRLYEEKPGASDFDSTDDVLSWISSLSDNNE